MRLVMIKVFARSMAIVLFPVILSGCVAMKTVKGAPIFRDNQGWEITSICFDRRCEESTRFDDGVPQGAVISDVESQSLGRIGGSLFGNGSVASAVVGTVVAGAGAALMHDNAPSQDFKPEWAWVFAKRTDEEVLVPTKFKSRVTDAFLHLKPGDKVRYEPEKQEVVLVEERKGMKGIVWETKRPVW